ncbi:MAG: HDOD domain-containing protein [Xanthomonadaceae bacterium]|nr:HDOD domain-containing protein [Xanthomonadaceae bacterium]
MFQQVVKSAELISLPDIYVQLRELIDDPGYTMAEVAVLVGRDPGMAARFLQVVNSPLNRRLCKIETVSHAVGLLGISQVHDIVLSASVAEAFAGINIDVVDMRKFWQRSFYCAVMTKQLALECDVLESDRLFTAGLLHDIGHLFMYIAIPEETQQAILKAKEIEKPLYQVERKLLGFDYARIGGYMMKQWDLPQSLQAITWFHPEPGKASKFTMEAALLHLGSLLVRSDMEDNAFGEGAFTVDSSVWQTTGLTAEKCLDLRQTAADQFSEVANSLFF